MSDGEISDGYHTFNELYEHRRALTAALLMVSPWYAWKSKAHHPDDGPMYKGNFIIGLELPTGPIRYHFELQHWNDFPDVVWLEHAPKWDGASSAETPKRLLRCVHGE